MIRNPKSGRPNIFPAGAYEGDAVAHGDNGLRATLGRAQHRRPIIGGFRQLVGNEYGIANGFWNFAITTSMLPTSPYTFDTPEGEQFLLTQCYDSSLATPSLAANLLVRFLLNKDIVTDWIQPAGIRTYPISATPLASVTQSNYTPPSAIVYTLSFDQIQFALFPIAISNVTIAGLYAYNSARFSAIGGASNT